jgi:hypothetical protein
VDLAAPLAAGEEGRRMSRSDLLIIAAMMPLVVYHSMKVGEAMALNQSFLWPELAVTVWLTLIGWRIARNVA